MPNLSQSSIKNLNYDVLQEIFYHCLPDYPLENFHTRTHSMQMVLCQICSFWRSVALTTPKLWSHLCYILGYTLAPMEVPDSLPPTLVFRTKQIEYLQWWNKNRGSIPPFLAISMKIIYYEPAQYSSDASSWVDGGSDAVASVIKYFTSAQYLETDKTFWDVIHCIMGREDQIMFPNVCSLVQMSMKDPLFLDVSRIGSEDVARDIFPSIRHLSLESGRGSIRYTASLSFPSHWSILTHVSFNIDASVGFWCRFIRYVPTLQSAYLVSFDSSDFTVPVEYTQSHLTTLFMESRNFSLQPSLLFSRLHLPALQELTLSFSTFAWYDNEKMELFTILKSTPNISMLSLRNGCPNFADPLGSIEPLWKYAPLLVHLLLDVSDGMIGEI
ncbi:hypothetical protein BDN70DRAFT_895111 [Pholiota conissans]|uniref:F-box domain-containing protein n=1 Tax=Pholiota conissans TaxID=109636 RepID=A0A9P5Z352_9AGAR|nr:hypothetical protein BDN70DRAFT_895111 [Pholiota conissans]